jgi:hypothetical protein
MNFFKRWLVRRKRQRMRELVLEIREQCEQWDPEDLDWFDTFATRMLDERYPLQ